MKNDKKLIVVSAVGLRQGGTLTILRNCLEYLSKAVREKHIRVIAIVHNKQLALYPGIEYIEMPNVIKSWGRRLWCEYITMHRISKGLPEISLWLSLHDTTPFVVAQKQAVYCQTSFPFYKCSLRDFYFQYKIALFSLFTKFAYRINVHRNNYLIVQQQWFRDGLSQMLNYDKSKIIVFPPPTSRIDKIENVHLAEYTFLYPSAPDCHKNFEVLCEAARLLENEIGEKRFKVILTLTGKENRYTRWLYKKWGKVSSIDFTGYMSKPQLYGYYQAVDCLVFPSKVETWGLPISEFGESGKNMLLANKPYAYETAAGCQNVAYFNENNPMELKTLMKGAILKESTIFHQQTETSLAQPAVKSWERLFEMLLS